MGIEDRDYMQDDYGGWGGQGPGGGWHNYQRPRIRFGPVISPTVKYLIIANAVVFFIDLLFRTLFDSAILQAYLGYDPETAIHRLFVWQFVTYMFMHAGILHIGLNMLVLWMFGSDVERRLGRKDFLIIYFLSGIFGAILFTLPYMQQLFSSGPSHVPTLVGASGGVMGVLMAFAMIYPERRLTLLFMFIFPIVIKAKYLILGYFIFEALRQIADASTSSVAHMAHLGGMIFAYIYMKLKYGLSLSLAISPRLSAKLRDFFQMRRWKKKSRTNYEPVNSDAFISDEIDPILEKISKHGMQSLTWREKRALRRAHSRMK